MFLSITVNTGSRKLIFFFRLMTFLEVSLEGFGYWYVIEIDFWTLFSKCYIPLEFMFFANFIAYGAKNDQCFLNIQRSKHF